MTHIYRFISRFSTSIFIKSQKATKKIKQQGIPFIIEQQRTNKSIPIIPLLNATCNPSDFLKKGNKNIRIHKRMENTTVEVFRFAEHKTI